MLQSISNAMCTVNGELCSDDQPLFSGEKAGKSSHATLKSTQTFKIDIFTEEVMHQLHNVIFIVLIFLLQGVLLHKGHCFTLSYLA